MTSTISVRLGKSILRDLNRVEKKWHADRSEVVRRLLNEAVKEWKVKDALDELRESKITIGEAAKKSEKPLWRIIDLAGKENIDWIGYSQDDLDRDLKHLR